MLGISECRLAQIFRMSTLFNFCIWWRYFIIIYYSFNRHCLLYDEQNLMHIIDCWTVGYFHYDQTTSLATFIKSISIDYICTCYLNVCIRNYYRNTNENEHMFSTMPIAYFVQDFTLWAEQEISSSIAYLQYDCKMYFSTLNKPQSFFD